MFLFGETGKTTLNLNSGCPPAHFGVLMPTEQQPNKRISELVKIIKHVYQEEPELLLHNEGRRSGGMENMLGTQETFPRSLRCFYDRR